MNALYTWQFEELTLDIGGVGVALVSGEANIDWNDGEPCTMAVIIDSPIAGGGYLIIKHSDARPVQSAIFNALAKRIDADAGMIEWIKGEVAESFEEAA